MPAIEITAQELAHHTAMLARTYEVRARLRPASKTRPVTIQAKPDPAPRKEIARHPSDMVRYKWPLSLPDPDLSSGRNIAKWMPAELIKQVAEEAGLHADQLKSGSRVVPLVRPRQFAMWLVKHRLPQMSLPQIGRAFGGRDHTTILHACRKIDRLIREGVIDPANPGPWFKAF